MGFTEDYTLAQDTAFLSRVMIAIVQTAIDVSSESEAAPNHVQRVQLSVQCLNNPIAMTNNMILGVVSGGTIVSASTDNDLKTRIASVWNAYAGIV